MSDTVGQISKLEEVLNQHAIQHVIASHSRGLDRLDPTLLSNCYWPDATVDYGSYKGPAHDFCQLVVQALPAAYELTQHKLGNTLITINGNVAKVESYISAYHLLQGAKEEMIFSGRYLDQLELRDNCWKIIHRTVVMDWSRNHTIEDQRHSEAFADLQKGSANNSDPLNAFLNP